MLYCRAAWKAGRTTRILMLFVIAAIVGGSILISSGVKRLSAVVDDLTKVSDFKDAIHAYSANAANVWAPGTIGGYPASLYNDTYSIRDGDSTITATSRYMKVVISPPFTNIAITNFNLTAVNFFSREPLFTSAPTTKEWSGSCRSYLTTYCVVVAETSPGVWALDSVATCFHKADAKYTESTSAVPVEFQVRQKGDPYITLERVTEGSDAFRSTTVDLRVGLIMIAAAILAGLAACVAVFVIHRLIHYYIKREEEDAHRIHTPRPSQRGRRYEDGEEGYEQGVAVGDGANNFAGPGTFQMGNRWSQHGRDVDMWPMQNAYSDGRPAMPPPPPPPSSPPSTSERTHSAVFNGEPNQPAGEPHFAHQGQYYSAVRKPQSGGGLVHGA